MTEPPNALSCPFCDFTNYESYVLMLHVETLHSEGDSPFEVREPTASTAPDMEGARHAIGATASPSHELGEDYVECPERDCGESILLTELEVHTDMHLAEKMTADGLEGSTADSKRHPKKIKTVHGHPETHFDTRLPSALRSLDPPPSRSAPPLSGSSLEPIGWRAIFGRKSAGSRDHAQSGLTPAGPHKRLGKAELGPHAFERQMPGWLRRQIEAGGMVNTNNQIRADGSLVKVSTIVNETTELVPVLAQLCEQDAGVDRAYLCHPGVRHVSKMKREGGFCGYRNIQMMVSYLRDAKAPGFESFGDGMPNILVLQDMIEEAWDRGFNSAGRIETGGIRGTRKYIGTPEAQALFLSLDIACEAKAYGRGDYGPPYERLLATIEQYFASAGAFGSDKVCRTRLPPVYFQHPGHSMTIVGFERKKSGSSNLLVFDPMFNPSPAISRLLHKTFRQRSSAELLKAYRRGQNYLRKYNAFETLQLTSPGAGNEGAGPSWEGDSGR